MKRSRYDESEQHLRNILRDARLKRGIKQEDLAEELQVPQSFISKYESGERMLTFAETISICQAIGFAPEVLLKDFLRNET